MARPKAVVSAEERIEGLDYVEITDGPQKGKYQLDVEPVGGLRLEDVSGLKNALMAERTRADELATASKSFEGLDPAKAREAVEKVAKMAKWTPEDKVSEQIEAATAALKEKYAKEAERANSMLALRNQAIEELSVKSVAAKAFAEHGINSELVELFMPHVLASTTVAWKDGETMPSVHIKGPDGKTPLPTQNSGTGAMGVEEFVGTVLKAKFESVWPANTGATGSGASGGSSGGARSGQQGQHIISASDARDTKKFRAANAAAKAAGVELQMVND